MDEPARGFPAGHFYSPVVDVAEVLRDRARVWPERAHALGIDFDEAGHVELLRGPFARLLPGFDYPAELPEGAPAFAYHERNSQFGWLDARALFVLLRTLRPRRMVEIGSGFSSLLTADVNRRFLGGTLDFTCVEPYPREFLKAGVPGIARLIEARGQDVPPSFFDSLEENDVLFVDSSHVSKTGSDVNHIVFEILPRLAPGVLIHFHDVFLPRDYPIDWVTKEGRSWNEQYVLQALLTHSSAYRVLFGCAYALDALPDVLRELLGEPIYGGGSLWIRKTAAPERIAVPPAPEPARSKAPPTPEGRNEPPMTLSLVHPHVLDGKEDLRKRFLEARPFRHLVIDGFFDDAFCKELLAAFPAFDERKALNELGQVGGKAVIEDIRTLGPAYRKADALFADAAFRELVGHLTGIDGLLYDPIYFGGGTHENRTFQSLDPHVDFNYHPVTGLHRRLNLIIYLNPEWDEAWGGSIEIHSNPRAKDNVVREFAPLFNRAILFETNEVSWHGFKRIRIPAHRPDVSRKSLTVYYYSETRPASEIAPDHTTFYVQRPLPEHLQAGHTLTTEDMVEIGLLIQNRDTVVRMHQDRDLKLGRLIEKLRESRDAGATPVIAVAGDLGPGATCTGYWPDGWVGRELVLSATPLRDVQALSVRGHAPDQLGDSGLPVTLRAAAQELTVTVAAGQLFEITLPVSLPKEVPFQLSVKVHDTFVPARTIPGSADHRELGFHFRGLVVKPA